MGIQRPRSTPADARPGEPVTAFDAQRQGGGLPRWLKLTALVVVIVVLLVVSMMLLGGGHNPMQHF